MYYCKNVKSNHIRFSRRFLEIPQDSPFGPLRGLCGEAWPPGPPLFSVFCFPPPPRPLVTARPPTDREFNLAPPGSLPRPGRNLCASGVNLFLTLLCMQFCVLYITAFSCRFRLLLSDNMHATKHSFCNADSSGVLPVADHMVL